jgi:hypothetical protein
MVVSEGKVRRIEVKKIKFGTDGWRDLSQLAENFTIIRKPLNYLAANLMSKQDKDWFISP